MPARSVEHVPNALRILVADSIASEGIERLRTAAKVDVRTGLSEDELAAAIPGYDALLVRSATEVPRRVIEAAVRLRVIGRAGVGVDNIDVDAATDRGIVVVNAPTGNTVSAAELTVALILALSRHVAAADASLRSGAWDRAAYVGVELRGKTAGVIGLGQVGSAVARRLVGLEMLVIAHDPFVPDDRARLLGVELAGFDDLLARADFLTLHTTFTPGSSPLLGAAEIARMKPGARLINTARGGLVDETALLDALDSGRLAGAAIDVFSAEPATANPLARHHRVVVTPHLGASTTEAQERVAVDVAHEILQVLDGKPATTAVNAPFLDPETMEAVGPYLTVAEAAGRLATQIATGQWQSVRIDYQGEIADHDVTALKAAAVAGLLAPISDEHVNLVSVNKILEQRGLEVVEQKKSDAGLYTNLITVRLQTAEATYCVSGALAHGEPHIVEIDGFRVDVSPDPQHGQHTHLLILRNEDRPGRIGAVGSALGEMGANISSMDVGTDAGGSGRAIMVLNVSRALDLDEVTSLAAIPGIEDVKQATI
jgi:D-3-phosphoglycerate dehydrogenase